MGGREERGPHPQTALGFLAPHLHRPVDVEVMQERVLDLGQNLAEELEHLLPHAGGVLRGRQRAGQQREPCPSEHCPPPPLPGGHLLCQPPSLSELVPSALPVPFPLHFSP